MELYHASNTEAAGRSVEMSKEFKYLIFATEYYRNKKKLSGAEVAALFGKHGIWQLILGNYFLYHIESPECMVADVDNYIETGHVIEV